MDSSPTLPSRTALQNATTILGQTHAYSPVSSMPNMAFHDLTINKSEPTSSRATPGLGLKLNPSPKFASPKHKIEPTLDDKFERNLSNRYDLNSNI